MKKRMLYKLLCVVICISVMCGCGTMKQDETNKEVSKEEKSEISEPEEDSLISKEEKGITKPENEWGERIYTGETPAQAYAEIAEVYYHGEEKISKEKHLELLEKYSESVPEYEELTAETIFFLKEKEDKIELKCFTQEEITTMPEVVIYSFADACEKGMPQEIKGTLPGLAEGLWYVIVIDGIEYIFCEYENDEPFLCAYSIISDKYSLANGLSVGMTKEEVFEMYPEMVEMDLTEYSKL